MTTQAQGAFAERAIGDGGLEAVLAARRAGRDLTAFQSLVLGADILALGALADGIRAEEVGEVVRITVRDAEAVDARAADVVPMPDASPDARGLLYLRAVAAARILGPKAAPVVVDWTVTGMELAQLALSFGASELAGPIVSKRGLPIAKDDTKRVKGQGMVSAALLKQQELVELIRRSGREPVATEGATESATDLAALADVNAVKESTT
ncbi:MAG: hypothetical protein IPG50_18890 [Myxococcales bacterium]|nr:hypothetical protein [Myxococcales bacterium]